MPEVNYGFEVKGPQKAATTIRASERGTRIYRSNDISQAEFDMTGTD